MKSGSRILTVRSRDYDTMLDRVARLIYEAETLRGGWSVRQLDRKINPLHQLPAILAWKLAILLARKKYHLK
jgi:predicted nuclease of restriction endonuclease-like (RecB) superfamily